MYNFYRWYKKGIIIFSAPTRALVDQQIEACYKYLDIPQNDYCELTGRINPEKREVLWRKHRIYFVSPQTLHSDLTRFTCPIRNIVCLVIDEAHRGQGEHSCHVIIRDICATNPNVRILALTVMWLYSYIIICVFDWE